MRIVFDTNVYIASLKEGTFTNDLLQVVLRKGSGFLIFISYEIFDELQGKLREFEGKKIITSKQGETLLDAVTSTARFVPVREKIHLIKADPDDDKILECAIAADANLIVSMDKDLLKLKQYRNIAIVHPKTFSFMMPKI